MTKIYPAATLTPHFREFLPDWLSRQSWYSTGGSGVPSPDPIGYFRFEDPGRVAVETHPLNAGSVVYPVPVTYRDAPIDNPPAGSCLAAVRGSKSETP